VVDFADPYHRLTAASPPQYIANATNEDVPLPQAEDYFSHCQSVLGPAACWLRVPHTTLHGEGYAQYVFTGVSPEASVPPAAPGETVLTDSIDFAQATLPSARPVTVKVGGSETPHAAANRLCRAIRKVSSAPARDGGRCCRRQHHHPISVKVVPQQIKKGTVAFYCVNER